MWYGLGVAWLMGCMGMGCSGRYTIQLLQALLQIVGGGGVTPRYTGMPPITP